MDAADAQSFLRRPWESLAALEREHWAREFARRGPAATPEASRLLWEHMRRIQPNWPSEAERQEDLTHHIALKGLIDRAARALSPPGTTKEPRGTDMTYWLVKSEPEDWSWAQQVAKGRDGAEWTGIRNFTAQRNLRAMKKGEQAFFYHTGKERAVVGIVRVIAEAHPDSTDAAWQAVDVAVVKKLPTPVGLDQIKADRRLAGMTLVRISRLSVQPVTEAEWKIICKMGGLP